MIDLTTRYLGLDLANPIVASAGPLTEHVETAQRLAQAGVAAMVLPSLFEEQIAIESHGLDRVLSSGESYAESTDYFPALPDYHVGPAAYLKRLRECKRAVDVPVIASLNGSSLGGWTEFARQMEGEGADAIELNIYLVPTDPLIAGSQVEEMVCQIVEAVRRSVAIPLAVKLSPYYSSIANLAGRVVAAGADGLVLFNRFYQPDLDIDALEVVPRLVLSKPYELLLRLHWCAILTGQVRADLAVTGGVHEGRDVIKSMMAGAKVAMSTSALLERGPEHVATMLHDIRQWMIEHDYRSIAQMQGSMSYKNVPNPSAFERANYMRVLQSYVFEDMHPSDGIAPWQSR